MPTQRSASMFKPGYEGARPTAQLSPDEKARVAALADPLVRRLHDSMLVLSVLDAHDLAGKGSGWPAYIHDRGDLNSQAELRAPEGKAKVFRPTPAQYDDFLPCMAMLEGLRSIYQQVLFLRAIGEFFGGWSFDEIGDRYEKTGEWARGAYQAVVAQAARRSGLLPAVKQDWAILVLGLRHAGHRTYVTTAQDPGKQLRDVKSKSPLAIEEAFCIWTAGQPVAKRLVGEVRKNLLGRPKHGSWHLVSPDDIADQIIHAARLMNAAWTMETLPVSAVRTRIIGQVGPMEEDEE